MDGRTRAGRAPLCCVRRVPGAPPIEPDALSTNLFLSLFLSSLPIFSFLAFWTLMDGRAPGARLTLGAPLCCARNAHRASSVRRAPGVRTSLWYIMTLVDGRAPGARSV